MKRLAIALSSTVTLSSVVALAAGLTAGQGDGSAPGLGEPPGNSPPGSEEEIDAGPLVEQAWTVWERDYDAWPEYAFRRYVERRRLDKQEEVEWSAQYLLEVSPTLTGFDERLIEIDGREPTPQEIFEHRRAGRFEERYDRDGSLENPFGKDLPVLPLLFNQRHEYVGRRVVRGHPCIKTEFPARNPPSREPARRRFEYVLTGSACFSIPGNHLVRGEMESAQAVSAGLVGLQYLRVEIESDPVGDGVWLPSRFEVRSDVRITFKQLRMWNLYRYFEFRRPEGAGGKPEAGRTTAPPRDDSAAGPMR